MCNTDAHQHWNYENQITKKWLIWNTWYTEKKFFDSFSKSKYIFSCDQAALLMVQSVCPSVCPSHFFDYVPIIVSSQNFQELLPMTEVTSMQKVKGQGHNQT